MYHVRKLFIYVCVLYILTKIKKACCKHQQKLLPININADLGFGYGFELMIFKIFRLL